MSDPTHPLNDPESGESWTDFFPGMFVRYGSHADRILRAACSSECAEALWEDARVHDVGAGLTREAGQKAAVHWCMHCAWCGELITGLGRCKVHGDEPCPEVSVEATTMVMRTMNLLVKLWPQKEAVPLLPAWLVDVWVGMAERELVRLRRMGPERMATALLTKFWEGPPDPEGEDEQPF